MASLNKVHLIGNITRDIDLRYTPKGTAIAEIGIATSRRVKNGDQWQDETTFIDVTLWGKNVENTHKFFIKGFFIFIEGRLHLDSWQDKDTGKNRTKLKVIAENIQFLGSKRQPTAEDQAHATNNTNLEDSEDIPF